MEQAASAIGANAKNAIDNLNELGLKLDNDALAFDLLIVLDNRYERGEEKLVGPFDRAEAAQRVLTAMRQGMEFTEDQITRMDDSFDQITQDTAVAAADTFLVAALSES